MIAKDKITKEKQKKEGAHFTPPALADFVVEQMLDYKPISYFASTISLLDPSVGEGELIVAFINKIPPASRSKLRIVGPRPSRHGRPCPCDPWRDRRPCPRNPWRP